MHFTIPKNSSGGQRHQSHATVAVPETTTTGAADNSETTKMNLINNLLKMNKLKSEEKAHEQKIESESKKLKQEAESREDETKKDKEKVQEEAKSESKAKEHQVQAKKAQAEQA